MSTTKQFLGLSCLFLLACSGGNDEAISDEEASPADAGSQQDGEVADAGKQAWECDPTSPFGTPKRVDELYPESSSQPWLSGDGLTLAFTSYDPEISLIETRITERSDRNATFNTPQSMQVPGISEGFTETALSDDKQWLYFTHLGEVLRAAATDQLASFEEAEVLELQLPSGTQYAEYPRIVDGKLYLSLREANWRRSIYAFDLQTGAAQPVLYDAGDIFSYALSANGLYLYVSFEVGGLETYRASRTSTSQPFSLLSYFNALNPQDEENGPYRVSAVSDDDCEIFAGRRELSTNTLHLWRSRRGE